MFHKSNFGMFGEKLPTDRNGLVPEAGDKPTDFVFDDEDFTQDFDGNGDGYEGYAADQWASFVEDAVLATEAASTALNDWTAAQGR